MPYTYTNVDTSREKGFFKKTLGPTELNEKMGQKKS
jgi:hypothetical protein